MMLTQAEEDLLNQATSPNTPGPPDFDHAFAPENDTIGRSVSPARLGIPLPHAAPTYSVDEQATVNWGPRTVAFNLDHERTDPFGDASKVSVVPAAPPDLRPAITSSRGPKLRIVTPGTTARGLNHKSSKVEKAVQQETTKNSIVNVTSIPSGSSASTSSTPLTASKQKSYTGRPACRRQAGRSEASSTSSGSSRPKFLRWASRSRKKERARFPGLPTRSESPTPFKLPRRPSRLPSFFIRERLYIPQHMQRRDKFLLVVLCLLAAVFVGIGVFAAARPHVVCKSSFLQNAVNAFLPSLLIGAPYTLVVVGIGLCGWGRKCIKGRYTPLLYLLVAAVGRVGIGALIGNLDWTLMAC